MSDELKELLDLRYDTDFQNDFENYVYCFSGVEIKLLLDYITILEKKESEENDKSKSN